MPIQRTSAVPVKIHNAISVASQKTGASFDYLVNTAKRESSFRTNAKSPSSSAAGLFQFVEGTWLKVVKDEGPRLGLGEVAKNIRKTSSGQYHVPNSRQRREILALRHDPETSALMAAAFTEGNERYVRGRIGRTPSDGELYLAHFLGPRSATRMIHLAENQPNAPANRHFPSAAKANKSIFYKNGQARSLADVKESLISSHLDGSGYGARRTNYGPLDFSVMGSLMSDLGDSGATYGKGQQGSIGIWGGGSSKVASASSSSSSNKKDVVFSAVSVDAGTSRASQEHHHKRAAEQYRSTQKTAQKEAPADPKWLKDAFGGN